MSVVRYDQPITDDVNIIEDQQGNRIYWRGDKPPHDRWKLIERNTR